MPLTYVVINPEFCIIPLESYKLRFKYHCCRKAPEAVSWLNPFRPKLKYAFSIWNLRYAVFKAMID